MDRNNPRICLPGMDQLSSKSDRDAVRKIVPRKKETTRKNKMPLPSGHRSKNGPKCGICISLSDHDELREEEKPVAVLSIVGGSGKYLPNETIKLKLKHGLLEIMNTTNIWIITEGKDTGVGEIVEENSKHEKKSKTRIFHKISENLTMYKGKTVEKSGNTLEACVTEHLKIPIITLIIGGEENSQKAAIKSLKMGYQVLVIDVSGNVGDDINEKNRLGIHNASEESLNSSKSTESETNVQSELVGKHNNIHVYSVNDTTDTLDRAIQDILFQLFCEGNKTDDTNIENILHYVNLWNRPDFAEKKIFNLQNREVLQKLQNNLSDKTTKLSKLFVTALVDNRVDIVNQVLEYIQDRKLYTGFLEENLETLYMKSGCTAGDLISQPNKNDMHIVEKINATVLEILGSRELKPFQKNINDKGEEQYFIGDEDIFKHLFIWAVLMDRRELAMFFWKKEKNDNICSAIFASSLAKCLAENPNSEAFMDQKASLLESSRYYEDLAYSVTTELYCIHKNEARTVLRTEVKRYSSTTILEIAEKFSLMKFVGHAASQTMLNEIWMGSILRNTSNLKAITAAFIPILIMSVVKLSDEDEMHESNGKTSKSKAKCHQWMRKVYNFYKSPIIKFLFHVLTYSVMLVIFSLFILTDLHPMSEKNPSVYECIIYAWATSLMTEEIRQAVVIKQVSRNLMTWFSFWTLFEVLMYSMLLTSIFLRLTLSSESFYHARMAYAITLGLFIVNSLQFFLVSKHIGPKVIMIGRMIYDIFFFVFIFAVFLFGFGVIYQATMYPNSAAGFQLFKEIVYMPYWQLYGELFLDQFEGKEPSPCSNDVSLYNNGTIARCPEVNQINTLLLAIYMVVTHIILVNILIAMFTHTFTKVQENNELVWKLHRYSLIQEYYDRSSLVPPLILISHIRRIVMFLHNKRTGKTPKKNEFKLKVKQPPNKLEENAVYNFVNLSARSKRNRAKSTEAEKDGLQVSHEREADFNLQEELEFLSSEMDIMQKNQMDTLYAVNKMKQKLLIIELPQVFYNRP